jgi:hypothetical protein
MNLHFREYIKMAEDLYLCDLFFKPFLDLFIFILTYYFVTRLVIPYIDYFYYRFNRNIPYVSFPFPIIGDYFGVMLVIEKDKTKFPVIEYMKNKFGTKIPPVVAFNFNSYHAFLFNTPEVVSELFGPMNKYLDKHIVDANMFSALGYKSILFSKTDEVWAQRRKSLSAAFYKERLLKMVEIIKKTTLEFVETWEKQE